MRQLGVVLIVGAVCFLLLMVVAPAMLKNNVKGGNAFGPQQPTGTPRAISICVGTFVTIGGFIAVILLICGAVDRQEELDQKELARIGEQMTQEAEKKELEAYRMMDRRYKVPAKLTSKSSKG